MTFYIPNDKPYERRELFKLRVFGLLTLSEVIKINILMDGSNHFLPVSIQNDAMTHTYTPHFLRKKNESKGKEK